jgi:hypothetical protein
MAKDRQKKDNHNISKFLIFLNLEAWILVLNHLSEEIKLWRLPHGGKCVTWCLYSRLSKVKDRIAESLWCITAVQKCKNAHWQRIQKNAGENVPKFYNLCSIPIFTLFSRNKNMFKLTNAERELICVGFMTSQWLWYHWLAWPFLLEHFWTTTF